MPPETNGNGHQCAMHNEAIKNELQDLRNHHKPLFREYDESRSFRQKAGVLLGEITSLVKFKEQARVIGVVGTLVFGASFIYTKNHINDSNQTHRDVRELVRVEDARLRSEMVLENSKLRNLIDNNEDSIDGLESSQLILNEKLARIDGSVFRIESRLSQLVEILADSGEVPRTTTLGNDPRGSNGGYK